MSKAAIRKDVVDLEALRVEYTTSGLSNRELGKKYKVSEGSIRNWAKTLGWPRVVELTPTPRKGKEKLPPKRDDVVSQAAEAAVKKLIDKPVELPMPRADFVEVAATQAAQVVTMIQGASMRLYSMVEKAAQQLDTAMERRDILEDLIIQDTADADLPPDPDNPGAQARAQRQRQAMLKAVALPTQITSLKDLCISMKHCSEMMRENWSIDGLPPPPEKPVAEEPPSVAEQRIDKLRERLRAPIPAG